MELINIYDNNRQVVAGCNFTFHEFYSPKLGGHGSFNMPIMFVPALQVFRNHYSKKYAHIVRWVITSVYRPGDDSWSPHKTGFAVDSHSQDVQIWPEILADIRNEFANWKTSELVKKVLSTGVNVLIIENACLHLSYRTSILNNHPGYDYDKFYIGEWRPAITKEEKKNSIYKKYGINTCYA